MKRVLTVTSLVLAGCALASGGDWPCWRGPGHNGVAVDSPALAETFPEAGPKKLWESEALCGGRGGWGSVAVADGCAYVFVDWSYNVPREDRVFEKGHLATHGYVPDMPEELSKKVEEARQSEERKNLKDWRAVNPWVEAWVKANVTEENKKYTNAVKARLNAGDKAVPLEVLAKLTEIADKEFPNEAAFEGWFKQNGIDDDVRKEATKWVKKHNPASKDYVVCLDAATGKTLWKAEVPSKERETHNDSSTPSVAAGRVYIITASSAVVCLDAKTGTKVWEKTPFEKPSAPHSSVLVTDGVVVASAHGTVGLDARTGEVLWEAKDLRSDNASPVPWKTGGMSCVIVNVRDLTCVETKTGKVVWKERGAGGSSTPAVADDHLALVTQKKLVAWKLSADKAEKLWEMPFDDDYASPLIWGDHVYAVGATPRGKKEGRAVCVELKTGKTLWDATVTDGPNCSSPIIADGKLVAFAGGTLALMRATPEKHVELGRAKIGGEGWTSPALADGRLFCRIGDKVICYELAK